MHIAGNDTADNYGLAISKATGYPSGTAVPALKRLSERDGLLARSEVATKTGKPRVVHSLTDAGASYVADLLDEIEPRIKTLTGVAGYGDFEGKVNLSTIWLLAAAAYSGGRINGYDTRMRPLTHQAAYVELDRLTAFGWFESVDGEARRMTEAGKQAAAALGKQWLPVIRAARKRLT